jgi:signal transduction histidine kinase
MRVKRPDESAVLDIGFAVIGFGLTAIAAWGPPGLIGLVISAPPPLLAVLPLLVGLPLACRRRAPLLTWTLLWAGIALQALVTRQPPVGPELSFVLVVGSYSLAAYSGLHRALAGLAVAAAGLVIYTLASHQELVGVVTIRNLLSGERHTPSLLLAGEILVCWLAGLFIRARRQASALAGYNAALQRQAERAVAAERARIARELHDIVAHHLSVVVLQAAGAQASGQPPAGTLEKIEQSGRQALSEMRRLLVVLREPDEEPELTPQPGLGELAALAERVRAAGLPVRLEVDGGGAALPAAVDVSVYRIVQEALTNVLKHAGPAHAEVSIARVDDTVTIEITDDGDAIQPVPAHSGTAQADGHGLAGMRERVALFGGELLAGPKPGGGFAVRVRLPLGEGQP